MALMASISGHFRTKFAFWLILGFLRLLGGSEDDTTVVFKTVRQAIVTVTSLTKKWIWQGAQHSVTQRNFFSISAQFEVNLWPNIDSHRGVISSGLVVTSDISQISAR